MSTLRDRVKAAFDEIDPMGLLKMGAPEDEYSAEVDDVVQRLQDGQAPGVQLVFEVMNRWFYTMYEEGQTTPCPRFERKKAERKPSPLEQALGERLEQIVREWNDDHQRT